MSSRNRRFDVLRARLDQRKADRAAGYEEGHKDGESSVHADIICFIEEELGLEVDERYTEPLLKLKAERDRLRDVVLRCTEEMEKSS